MRQNLSLRKALIACVVLVGMGGLLMALPEEQPASPGSKMIDAAASFLKSLEDGQRKQATFSYDDPERVNWHFIPRERKGIPLRDLDGEALKQAQQLIQTGLSTAGYDQALNVMSLEEVLYLLEGGEREVRRERRDPRKYYLTVFGEPSANGSWGWRLEGHHLSLNYSITDGQVVASTPEFFGANPGYINAGPEREIRVLGAEEDLARQLLKLATPEQQKVMWISQDAPDDVRGGGAAQPVVTEPVGLAAKDMTEDQKQLLGKLLSEYLKNMPAEVEQARRDALMKAGFENIHFAWWGKADRNERHHYVVQGPTFIIEYNNTQNNANHVHSMWRDLAGDFNIPLKKD